MWAATLVWGPNVTWPQRCWMRPSAPVCLSPTSRPTSGLSAWSSGKSPAEPSLTVRRQPWCGATRAWVGLHFLFSLIYCVYPPLGWEGGSVSCLSALGCFSSLGLSPLSFLMISAAIIINSLILCQHSLLHSPDAHEHSLWRHPCVHDDSHEACLVMVEFQNFMFGHNSPSHKPM